MICEVALVPAEFERFRPEELERTACVVFDVLRATTTLVTAIANGASGIRPVGTIDEALAERARNPDCLLAGERGGRRIGRESTGGIEFDFGNSPGEFVAARVAGREIVMTTTNGTRALKASAPARAVMAAGFVNLEAAARQVCALDPDRVLLVCSGTGDRAALEDILAAGAFVERVGEACELSDSAWVAVEVWRRSKADLSAAVARSSNARRLLAIPELAGDVAQCLSPDRYSTVPVLACDGVLRVSRD